MKNYTKFEAIKIVEQCSTKKDLENNNLSLTSYHFVDKETGLPYYRISYYNEKEQIVELAQFWEKEQITLDYIQWLKTAPIFKSEKDAENLTLQIIKDDAPDAPEIESTLICNGFWLSRTLFNTDYYEPYKMIFYKNQNEKPKRLNIQYFPEV